MGTRSTALTLVLRARHQVVGGVISDIARSNSLAIALTLRRRITIRRRSCLLPLLLFVLTAVLRTLLRLVAALLLLLWLLHLLDLLRLRLLVRVHVVHDGLSMVTGIFRPHRSASDVPRKPPPWIQMHFLGMRVAFDHDNSRGHIMARSSLTGIEEAPTQAEGRDEEALGPSDSSDSGSDLVGIDALKQADPNEPVDLTVSRDIQHAPLHPHDNH